jgi:hypothetical protein
MTFNVLQNLEFARGFRGKNAKTGVLGKKGILLPTLSRFSVPACPGKQAK